MDRIAAAGTGVHPDDKSADSTLTAKELLKSVEDILMRSISQRPADVRVLDAVFAAATEGTVNQRKAAIEVFASLKEPLAEPLLAGIAGDSGNPLNRSAAEALSRIRSTAITDSQSRLTRYFQIIVLAGCILIAGGLIAAAWTGRSNGNPCRVVLLLVCVVLTSWLFGIICSDYLVSRLTAREIDLAIRGKQISALAKKINFEWSGYPGDSYAARYLVSKGDSSIIPLLTQIKTEIPQSLRYQDYWNKRLQQRIDWTIARLEEMRRKSAGSQGTAKHSPPDD